MILAREKAAFEAANPQIAAARNAYGAYFFIETQETFELWLKKRTAGTPQREPLLNVAIDSLWGDEPLSLPQIVKRREIARAVEAAHGIPLRKAKSDEYLVASVEQTRTGRRT